MSERRIFWALAAMLVLVWLGTLGMRPLFDPDEGRYAEIPREMLAGGDWIIPHLNGVPYIEKPPLQYWATALSLSLFGKNPFAARLYTALCAFGTLFAVGYTARVLAGARAGWCAAAVLCGMLMFPILGQLLTLDMSLTFYTTVAFAGFLLAQREAPAPGRAWMITAWVAAALGVLSKGLVAAAIPAAVLVLYSLYTRDFKPWRRLNIAWGLPVFLAITIPWHWLAAARLPDFLQFFFVREHFARYLTPVEHREQSWWFFPAVFMVGTLPWMLPMLRVVCTGWRRPPRGVFSPALFSWLWIVFVIVFFSLSDSKLMPYILPALPALALAIALSPSAVLRREFALTGVLTVLAAAALGLASLNWARVIAASDRIEYFLPLAKPLGEIALLLFASGLFVLVQRHRGAERIGVFLGVGWCLTGLLLMRAAALVSPIYSTVDLAAAIAPSERDAPVYSVDTYAQSVPFYLDRTVTLVGYRGELDYGIGRHPDGFLGDLATFTADWKGQSRGFAVMEKNMFADLEEKGLPMRVIGSTWGRVVVARQ